MRPIAAIAASLLAFALVPIQAVAAPKIVATIAPLHALAALVMDGVGTPLLLIDAAADPHGFQLKPSTARALAEADLILWIGPALEGPLAAAIRALARPERALALMERPEMALLPLRPAGVFEHGADDHAHPAAGGVAFDPHLWLDPRNGQAILAIVAAELTRLDPSGAERYAANAASARKSLAALEAELAARLERLAGRPYVVLHDAFQYFEARFGLAALGAIVAPERLPGAGRLALLQRTMAEAGARCVFGAPQFVSALPAALADGTWRQGVLDDLGADLPPGPDAYPRLLRRLAEALAGCLE